MTTGTTTDHTIVIVGAGQAGAQAVDTLRREGYGGHLVLIGDEPDLPYQRPPLSKKFLSGELPRDRLPFRHRAFYDEHRVRLLLGVRAVRLDRDAHQVLLATGEEVRYDRLLLCLGADCRRLSCPGASLAGVHTLRGIADAAAIHADMRPGARAVIIGGGYIGLETASTARALGCEVTVLEMADRVMNRVVDPAVSSFFARSHAAHGVRIVCDTRVVALEGTSRVTRVVCADGSRHEADFVVVGVGAVATTALAAESGLACNDGIVVDEFCRTADPAVFAAGDCTNHPSIHYGRRLRLESVDNAFEQAKAAALNLLDRGVAYDRVPWFWSDQFEHKLLIVGLSAGHDQVVVRGVPAAGGPAAGVPAAGGPAAGAPGANVPTGGAPTPGFSVCYLRDRRLLALEAVDHPKDYMAARKLIAERIALDPDKLADGRLALKDAV